MDNVCSIILAAGDGTRMKSSKPKVLCEVLQKPMIAWVQTALSQAGIFNTCVVLGKESESIKKVLLPNTKIAIQSERKGTGHAASMAIDFMKEYQNTDVLLLNGDAPFIDAQTIKDSYQQHKAQGNQITTLCATLADPTGYGRILQKDGNFIGIIEQTEANEAVLAIRKVNSGAYWFEVSVLIAALGKITNHNKKGEYYLTDCIQIAVDANQKVGIYTAENSEIVLGANDRTALAQLNEIARIKEIQYHLEKGVDIPCFDGVMIAPEVEIGMDTTIYPGTILKGNTKIGTGCTIIASFIDNTMIGNQTTIRSSYIYENKIGDDVCIGPFAHLRPNNQIEDGVKIGDFVEIKNSIIGEKTSLAHLTYIGDSEIGKNVNVGCGVVTVNYDGSKKAKTIIQDGAFVGCNTNLVAPVSIGRNAYTAAGTTVTHDVPDDSLVIGRIKQEVKHNWLKK
ncbi:MAG: bifunctional UDP-N-acetylglucosamine diphosphorylase/glucosamine-1-phosphate N-acetyltransferase GlmU [Oscillospiraceae bacterium]